MKPIVAFAKPIVFYLSFIMLFQSCQVYYHASVPLNIATETSGEQLKKIKTKDGEVYRLRRIEERNGRLYGQRTKGGITSYMSFTEEDIKSIQLQNVDLSQLGNVAIVIGTAGAVIFLIGVIQVRNLDFGTLSFP